MAIDAVDFQRRTGCRLADEDNDGTPETVFAPTDRAPVHLSLEIIERFYALHGGSAPHGKDAAALPKDAAVAEIRRRLTKTGAMTARAKVSDADALTAHAVLMRLPAVDFSRALAALSTSDLNTYVGELLQARPWSLRDQADHPLSELTLKVALSCAGGDADALVTKLDRAHRVELVRGFLTLPGSDAYRRFRTAVGEAAFRTLVGGTGMNGLLLLAGHYPERNVTALFRALHDVTGGSDPRLFQTIALPENRKSFQFLMLKGLLGDELPRYMMPTKNALIEAGIRSDQVHYSAYNTADSTTKAALAIAHQVEDLYARTGQRVVLIGHSAGCLHTHTLLTASRAQFSSDEDYALILRARSRLAGDLLIQPAVRAQIALDVSTKAAPKALLDHVLPLIEGSEQAFKDLSSEAAVAPFPGAQLPTVVLATDTVGRLASLRPAQLYYEAQGVPSDGAVPAPDQVPFDGADFIYLAGGADHAQPGLDAEALIGSLCAQLESGAVTPPLRIFLHHLSEQCPMAKVILRPIVGEGLDRVLGKKSTRKKIAAGLRLAAKAIGTYLRKAHADAGNMDSTRATQAALRILLNAVAAKDKLLNPP